MKARDEVSLPPGAVPGARVGRYRYLVAAVVCLTFCIGALDRANVSLLLVDRGFLRDMGLEGSPERQGLVMSALLLPYALSNIFLGPAADRWGPRRVLVLMTGIWSAAALLLGAAGSYAILLAGRAVRGTAEGPLFPVANRYVRNWFPPTERAVANAVWTSGQRVGLAVAIPLLTAAIAAFGWRFSFFLQAVLIAGAVVPAVWLLTADRPEGMPRMGKAELAHIAKGKAGEGGRPAGGRGELRDLVGNRRFWLAVAHHLALLSVYYGLVTWLPRYLTDARGFESGRMVLFASAPHVASTLTALPFAFLSDRLGRRGVFCAGSLAGASAAVCLAALVPDPTASALLMVLGFAVWGVNPPAYYAMMQRLIPGRIMATGIGLDNGVANLGAAMAPTVMGFLIGATGSYLAGLLFLVALGAAGTAAAVALAVERY